LRIRTGIFRSRFGFCFQVIGPPLTILNGDAPHVELGIVAVTLLLPVMLNATRVQGLFTVTVDSETRSGFGCTIC
jgi:hypothetical protein